MSCHCDIIRCIQAGQFEIQTLFMHRIRMLDKAKMCNVEAFISYFYPGTLVYDSSRIVYDTIL